METTAEIEPIRFVYACVAIGFVCVYMVLVPLPAADYTYHATQRLNLSDLEGVVGEKVPALVVAALVYLVAAALPVIVTCTVERLWKYFVAEEDRAKTD